MTRRERTIVARGQLVFDRTVIDVEEDYVEVPLVVVDPDAGTVAEQSSETREHIRDAPRNSAYDTSDTAECVDVLYVNSEFSNMVYTFPRERLYAPEPSSATWNWPPAVWAQAHHIVYLYRELDIGDVEAMRSGIEGQVMLAARDVMTDHGLSLDSADDVVSTEELTECPDCDDMLRLHDSIESTGEGVAFGYVRCDGCGFEGTEEWVHKRTVRTDTEPES